LEVRKNLFDGSGTLNQKSKFQTQQERILSNGDIEKFTDINIGYRSQITNINIKKMKQTMNMFIE
jgi:hypothetical protein